MSKIAPMSKTANAKEERSYGALARLMKYAKAYLPQVILAALFLIGSTLLSILAPNYLGKLTDHIADNAQTRSIDLYYINQLGFILVGFFLGQGVCQFLTNFLLARVSQLFGHDLRSQVVRKINAMPLKYFDSTQYGDTLSVLTNDVDQIGTSLNQGISMVISGIFMLIGVLIAMFITSWAMALTVLASLPFMIIFLLIVTKLAVPQFNARQEELGEVNAIVEEQFSGQFVIKAFVAEDSTLSEFNEANNRLDKTMFTAQIYGGSMMPINSFISYLVYAAVCLVGGLLMNNGGFGVSFGTITVFLVYANLFQSPLSQIGQASNTLQMASASAKRVEDLLKEPELSDDSYVPDVFARDEHGHLAGVKGEVDFEHVRFGYDPDRTIIHDFTCHVEPGMKVAIVGPTGAGKTTIVNLLMRFYELNGGSIKVDGHDIAKMKRSEVHDLFAMVLQDTWVFEGTIRENVAYGIKDVPDEKIMEILNEANLAHYVATLPGGLDYVIEDEEAISVGQKQLFTIARAMAEDAPLMILDEATSNVDTRTEELIQEAMDRLTENRTSFVIAHRLSTIKNSDLILVLKDGNVIEQGRHEELLAKQGFYYALYNSQFALD